MARGKIRNGKVYVKGRGTVTYRGQEFSLSVKETGTFTGNYLASAPSTAYEGSSIEIIEPDENNYFPEALEGIINYIVDQINEVVNYSE